MKNEASFEILCTTMNQSNFKRIESMNVRSNIVFANQCDTNSYKELVFDGKHIAKMVSTNTKGVGANRNISLLYATRDICLLSDDDMLYVDNVEEVVLEDFLKHPDADVIVFNIGTNSAERPEKINKRFHRLLPFEKSPYGAVRIAFRLKSIRKVNACFSVLFGGGSKYQSGEDTLFLSFLRKKRLKVFVSEKFIGTTDASSSSWFEGYNRKYYFSKGAYLKAAGKKFFFVWVLYYALRNKRFSSLRFSEKVRWMKNGAVAFRGLKSYDEFVGGDC